MRTTDIPSLVAELSSRRGRVREKARETLVEIGGPAVPFLLPLADAPSKKLRWEVVKALSSIADPRAIPVLTKRLSDPESDIRWLAAVGLIQIGPASIPAVLRTLMDNSQSTGLRRAAHHVLHDLADHPEVAEFLAPVLASLGDADPADAIPPAALTALRHFEQL